MTKIILFLSGKFWLAMGRFFAQVIQIFPRQAQIMEKVFITTKENIISIIIAELGLGIWAWILDHLSYDFWAPILIGAVNTIS